MPDREYPTDLLHAVMHALADGGCAEDERGAALAALDAVADWADDHLTPLWTELPSPAARTTEDRADGAGRQANDADEEARVIPSARKGFESPTIHPTPAASSPVVPS